MSVSTTSTVAIFKYSKPLNLHRPFNSEATSTHCSRLKHNSFSGAVVRDQEHAGGSSSFAFSFVLVIL